MLTLNVRDAGTDPSLSPHCDGMMDLSFLLFLYIVFKDIYRIINENYDDYIHRIFITCVVGEESFPIIREKYVII